MLGNRKGEILDTYAAVQESLHKASFEHTSHRLSKGTRTLRPSRPAPGINMTCGLQLAFKLVLYLGNCSYTRVPAYSYHPTHPADSFCVELSKLLKAD